MSAETYGPELTAWPAREDMPDGSMWEWKSKRFAVGADWAIAYRGRLSTGMMTFGKDHFMPGDTLRRVHQTASSTAVVPIAQPDPGMAAFLDLAYQLGVVPNGRHVDSIMQEALARVAVLHRRDGEAIRRREAIERLAGTDEDLADSDLVGRALDRIHGPVELPAGVTAKEIDAAHTAFLYDSSGDLTLGEWLLEHFNITKKA